MFKLRKLKRQTSISLTLSAAIMLTACGGGSSSDGEDEIDIPEDTNLTSLDATDSTLAARLDLQSGHTVTDDAWHIAYQKYIGFKVNGGFTGEGEVSGCIAHQYEELFDENGAAVESEFAALNIENTEADFDAVDKTYCLETDFIEDGLKTTIVTEDWLNADYSQGAPVFSALEGNGWIIRSSATDSASGEYNYARVKVKEVDVVFGESITRKITLQVENWDPALAVFNEAVDSPVLDFTSERVFFDIETNTIVTEADDWDLSIMLNGRDYPIQVNAGASGEGTGGAGVLLVDNVDAVTDPSDSTQVYRYFGDSVEGILSQPGSYGPLQYNVQGQHKMWPTFTTYIIKDGESYFKVQVVSNYGADGTAESANLYLRYEELID